MTGEIITAENVGLRQVLEPEIVNPDAKIDPQALLGKGVLSRAAVYSEPLPTIYNGSGQTLTDKGETVDWFDRDISNQGIYQGDEPMEGFTALEQFNAFWETENTVGSYLAEQGGSDVYNRDFDPLSTFEAYEYPDLVPQLLRANNQSEMDAIVFNHQRESRNREIIDASGIGATLGYSAIAMTLDPVLLPAMLYTGGTAFLGRIGATGTAALWAGTAGTAEIIAEAMKHDSQQQRTLEESYMNIGAATVLSGLFGGVAGKMASKELARVKLDADRVIADIASDVGKGAKATHGVNEPMPKDAEGASGGAAKVGDTKRHEWQREIKDPDSLQVKGTGTTLEKWRTNPLVRLSQSRVPLARRLAVLLADSPYYYKGYEKGENLTGSRHSVERQKKMYIAKFVNANNKVNEIYLRDRGVGGARALIEDATGKTEKAGHLTFRQFQKELGKALRREDATGNATIDQSAKVLREEVLKPMMDDAIEAGIFDEGVRQSAEKYFPRLYDYERLAAESDDHTGGFVDRVYEWLKGGRTQAEMDLEMQGARIAHHEEQSFLAAEELRNIEKAKADADREWKAYKTAMRWDIDPNDPEQVRQALKMKTRPLHLSTWIREQGGITDVGGELSARDVNNEHLVAIMNKNGKDPEHLIQKAVEEGYYTTPDYNEISLSRFFDDIAQDMAGDRIYNMDVRYALDDGMNAMQNDYYYRYGIEELGLSRKSTKGEIQAAIARDSGQDVTPETIKRAKAYKKQMDEVVRDTNAKIDAYRAFAELTDKELRDIASQTKGNILGVNRNEFNEAMLPDIAPFKAGSLKDRKLKMDDSQIEDYLVHDADDVIDYYTKAVSPQIVVAKEFGDIRMTEARRAVDAQYNQARNDLERELVKEGADKKKVTKELQALNKEHISANRDLDALLDKLYGQYNRPVNPDSFWNKAGQLIKAVNFMRLLGGMTVSAIPDLARPVFKYGFAPVARDLMALKGNKALKEAAMADIKAANLAIESLATNHVNRFSDLTEFTGARTKFERGVETTQNIFAKATLMPFWNDTLKGFSGLITQNEMAKAILNPATDGKLLARQRRELAKAGIGEQEIEHLRHYLKKYGEEGDLFVPNGDSWGDELLDVKRTIKTPDGDKVVTDQVRISGQDMRTLWRGAVGKTVDDIIVTPSIGEMPLWISGGVASVIMQFKSFPISAHSKMLIQGLQQQDRAVLEGLLMAGMLGAAVIELKALINGRETPDNAGDYAYDALDRTGVFGWLNEPIQFASMATRGQVSPSRLWGSDSARVSRYQSRNLLGAALGPSADIVGDLASVTGAIATGDFSEGDISAGRKMLPFQNIFYFKWLLDHLQEKI